MLTILLLADVQNTLQQMQEVLHSQHTIHVVYSVHCFTGASTLGVSIFHATMHVTCSSIHVQCNYAVLVQGE